MDWNSIFNALKQLNLHYFDMHISDSGLIDISATSLPLGKGDFINFIIDDNNVIIDAYSFYKRYNREKGEDEYYVQFYRECNVETQEYISEPIKMESNKFYKFLKDLKETIKK